MITVFGSVNMDLTATANRLPYPGETVGGNGFVTAAGGKGANQALAACRAGAHVRMAGAVGDDDFAEPALALLREGGVDLGGVETVAGTTGIAVILVGGDGENMITVVPGANGTLQAQQAEDAIAEMTPGDTVMLQLEIPAIAVERALNCARERGVRSILNVAPLTEDAVRLGRMADIVVANETEFELLAGTEIRDAEARRATLAALHAETGQTFVVTLGGEGAIAIENGRFFSASGLAIEPIDTVGAGDTFCGYLAAGLDAGLSLSDAMHRAAVAGSLACLKAGAQTAVPLAADIR
ncbi:ribokinase [Martelella mangrovi]|uniref:Ribokinase n=1 Tax=Martelella mangrovi TaxID=1397477 RepID=A0ABV2ICB2_9HYPH